MFALVIQTKKKLLNKRYIAVILLLVLTTLQSQAESPKYNDTDLANESGILFWGPEQQVYGFPRIADLYPTRSIEGQEVPLQLPVRLSNLDAFSYSYAGQTQALE